MVEEHHHHHDNYVPTAATTANRDPLSWRAIFAGAIAAMAVQALLTVLGLAIGMNVAQDGAGSGLAIGAGIWWIITGCISLFIGGWIAGNAGRPWSKSQAMLHGFLQWTLVTVLSAMLVGNVVGALFGSTLRITSTLGNMVGQSVQAMVPSVDMKAGQIQWGQMEQQIAQVLDSYAPQAVQQQEGRAQVDWSALAKAFLEDGGPEQRQRLLDTLQQEWNLSEQEAQQVLNELQQTYKQAKQQLQEGWQEVKQTTAQAAQQTAEVSADAAWWSFFTLLLGAVVATIGGGMGGRSRPEPHAVR